MHAPERPSASLPGFGFSETAFRIFILLAWRRLKSDPFFTDDYGAELYSEFGLDHIKQHTMLSILALHYPALAPSLASVDNAFHPSTAVTASGPEKER